MDLLGGPSKIREVMAVKCSGCGNFISSEIQTCPICGDKIDCQPSSYEVGSHPTHGLMADLWNSFQQSRDGGFTMTRKEALLLKILMSVLVLILAVTLFVHP